MARRGLSQRQLCERAGMVGQQQLLSKRLRGIASWPVDNLEHIAGALEVELSTLLTQRA